MADDDTNPSPYGHSFPGEAEGTTVEVRAGFEPGSEISPGLVIVRQIGRGAQADVYEVRDTVSQERSAVKVLPAIVELHSNWVARLEREARTTSAIRHPNIVRTYGVERTTGGALYTRMELLEGKTLASMIREGPLTIEEARTIGAQAARGLAAAHGIGVTHRDLKPSNIFVLTAANGALTAKVLDFGIAKEHAGPELTQLTQTGMVIGTPAYMAPEQAISPATLDGRADIYSLGVVLYEALAGEPPFKGGSIAHYILQHVKSVPRDLRELRPELPEPLANAIMRMLAKHPDERPSSMDLVAALLEGQVPGIKKPAASRPADARPIARPAREQTAKPPLRLPVPADPTGPPPVELLPRAPTTWTPRVSPNESAPRRSSVVVPVLLASVLSALLGAWLVRAPHQEKIEPAPLAPPKPAETPAPANPTPATTTAREDPSPKTSALEPAPPMSAPAREPIDLMRLIVAGDTNRVREALESGQRPIVPSDGWSALHEAARRGQIEIAKALLEHGSDVDGRTTSEGYTPLHVAVLYDQPEITNLLLRKGATRDLGDSSGDTPLHLAIDHREATQVANALLSNNAAINARDARGRTPLLRATLRDDLAWAKLLLERGASTSIRANDGGTPLLHAAAEGRTEMVKLLLEHHADTSASTNGADPALTADDHGHGKIADLIRSHQR